MKIFATQLFKHNKVNHPTFKSSGRQYPYSSIVSLSGLRMPYYPTFKSSGRQYPCSSFNAIA